MGLNKFISRASQGTPIWSGANPREVIHRAATPLTQSITVRAVDGAARAVMADCGLEVTNPRPMADFLHGYFYLNVNYVTETSLRIPGRTPRDVLEGFGFAQWDLLEDIGIDPDFKTPTNWETMKIGVRSLRLLVAMNEQVKALPELKREMRELVNYPDEVPNVPQVAPTRENWEEIKSYLNRATYVHALASNFAYGLWGALQGILPESQNKQIGELTAGITGMTTAEMITELYALAQELGRPGDEIVEGTSATAALQEEISNNPVLQKRWTHFLRTYGHRALDEVEIAQARWIEAPDYLLRLLLSRQAEPPNLEKLAAQRETVTREIAQELGAMRRRTFQWLLQRVQAASAARESTKDAWMMATALIRWFAMALAARRDVATQDIWFYAVEEFESLLDGGDPVPVTILAGRRQTWQWQMTLIPPEVIYGEWEPQEKRGVETATQPEADTKSQAESGLGTVLKGLGVSKGQGQVEGTAIVMTAPNPEKLSGVDQPILVTKFTDPAWTMLFPGLTAVVTERGGVLSHAAIVSRELGIPAVVGIADVDRRIHTGDRIWVDGANGEVGFVRTW